MFSNHRRSSSPDLPPSLLDPMKALSQTLKNYLSSVSALPFPLLDLILGKLYLSLSCISDFRLAFMGM